MDQRKAERVLEAVETEYAEWIALNREDGMTDPDYFPINDCQRRLDEGE